MKKIVALPIDDDNRNRYFYLVKEYQELNNNSLELINRINAKWAGNKKKLELIGTLITLARQIHNIFIVFNKVNKFETKKDYEQSFNLLLKTFIKFKLCLKNIFNQDLDDIDNELENTLNIQFKKLEEIFYFKINVTIVINPHHKDVIPKVLGESINELNKLDDYFNLDLHSNFEIMKQLPHTPIKIELCDYLKNAIETSLHKEDKDKMEILEKLLNQTLTALNQPINDSIDNYQKETINILRIQLTNLTELTNFLKDKNMHEFLINRFMYWAFDCFGDNFLGHLPTNQIPSENKNKIFNKMYKKFFEKAIPENIQNLLYFVKKMQKNENFLLKELHHFIYTVQLFIFQNNISIISYDIFLNDKKCSKKELFEKLLTFVLKKEEISKELKQQIEETIKELKDDKIYDQHQFCTKIDDYLKTAGKEDISIKSLLIKINNAINEQNFPNLKSILNEFKEKYNILTKIPSKTKKKVNYTIKKEPKITWANLANNLQIEFDRLASNFLLSSEEEVISETIIDRINSLASQIEEEKNKTKEQEKVKRTIQAAITKKTLENEEKKRTEIEQANIQYENELMHATDQESKIFRQLEKEQLKEQHEYYQMKTADEESFQIEKVTKEKEQQERNKLKSHQMSTTLAALQRGKIARKKYIKMKETYNKNKTILNNLFNKINTVSTIDEAIKNRINILKIILDTKPILFTYPITENLIIKTLQFHDNFLNHPNTLIEHNLEQGHLLHFLRVISNYLKHNQHPTHNEITIQRNNNIQNPLKNIQLIGNLKNKKKFLLSQLEHSQNLRSLNIADLIYIDWLNKGLFHIYKTIANELQSYTYNIN